MKKNILEAVIYGAVLVLLLIILFITKLDKKAKREELAEPPAIELTATEALSEDEMIETTAEMATEVSTEILDGVPEEPSSTIEEQTEAPYEGENNL